MCLLVLKPKEVVRILPLDLFLHFQFSVEYKTQRWVVLFGFFFPLHSKEAKSTFFLANRNAAISNADWTRFLQM